MKFRSLLLAAASFVLAACSGSSDKTVLTGIVSPLFDGEIYINVAGEETVVNASNGKFTAELPVELYAISSVETPEGTMAFISDGTKITIDFTQENPIPKSSGKGACAAYAAYEQFAMDFSQEYNDKMQAIFDDQNLTQDEKDSKMEATYYELFPKFLEESKKTVKANTDNYLSVLILRDIYGDLEADELMDVISSLAPQLQEDSFVAAQLKSAESLAATSEGKMFTDFSAEYNGKTEKLSDYVGKGKYILVDFWASWCGPCKREIPNLKNVYSKFHGDKFDILSVAVWDEPQASIDTAAVYQIPWNHMLNAQQVPTDLYGIQGIPHIILFGPDGQIVKRNLRGENIEKTVAEYVK